MSYLDNKGGLLFHGFNKVGHNSYPNVMALVSGETGGPYPPPAPEGEGSERIFGMEVTKYRCKNGYQWANGKWPYLEMECLNKKWAPKTLPDCVCEYH